MTPEERDRLTRLEEQYDYMNKATNERFMGSHERDNRLQADYIEFDKRLRKVESTEAEFIAHNRLAEGLNWEHRLRELEKTQLSMTVSNNTSKAWWAGLGVVIGAVIAAFFRKVFP